MTNTEPTPDTSPEAVEAMRERLKGYANHGPQASWRSQCERDAIVMLRAVASERDARAIGEEVAFNQRNMALDAVKVVEAKLSALIAALSKIAPIVTNDGPYCADLCFSDGIKHSTQAMTLNPQDWLDIQAAYEAAVAEIGIEIDADYELADRMIGAFENFVSGHRVERVRLAADILKRTRPAYQPFWENPDGPTAA